MKNNLSISVPKLIKGIVNGEIPALSKAISLVESKLPIHQKWAQELEVAFSKENPNTIRVGISGVPGVGKSTLIEALGMYLVEKGLRLAVLTIDPSSQQSGGSILGDKTRMDQLAAHKSAYIRTTAAASTLGGVAQNTRSSILFCEAAGFDVIIVETVGVGQNELEVHEMVDALLLLQLPGAGDEIQGIKRGLLEVADALLINKADGAQAPLAKKAQQYFKASIHGFRPRKNGWEPPVLLASAIENRGVKEMWQSIEDFIRLQKKHGDFELKRTAQKILGLHRLVCQRLEASFYADKKVQNEIPDIKRQLTNGTLSISKAAEILIDGFRNSHKKSL
ncbi:methylmalonyl Co-A mutase-associated GTPase MeaB [Flavobacteriaceae bacterium]|nr:methylmalonyl Co-A mutase-associated GTPase MeaB [Flavobacteriaceae bacterium]